MSYLIMDLNTYPLPGLKLTRWGRVTHICVGKLIIIGSDNGLSPRRRQAIIWTNAGIWSMGPLGINFSEILIEIQRFPFKKMHLKMSSAKLRLFCLGINELINVSKRVFWKKLYLLIGPVDSNPFYELILTYCHCGPVAFAWGLFHTRHLTWQSLRVVWKLHIE